MRRKRHCLTVAVEDYFQVSAFERLIPPRQWSRFETRVDRNTQRALDLRPRNRGIHLLREAANEVLQRDLTGCILGPAAADQHIFSHRARLSYGARATRYRIARGEVGRRREQIGHLIERRQVLQARQRPA